MLPTLFTAASLAAESVPDDMFSSVMDRTTTFSERAQEALRVFAIGLGTVFAVLAVICAVLYLFKLFFYEIPTRRKKAKATVLPDADAVPTPVASDDGELVAAITAALSIVLEKPAASFRIVSFKRTK